VYHALLRQAEAEGQRMTLVVPGPHDDVDVRGPHTRIVHLRAPRSPIVDDRYRLLLPHHFLFGRSGALWRLLDAEQPDVVEVCDKYSLCFFAGLIRRRRAPRPALVGLSCERLDANLQAFVSRSPRVFLGPVYIGMFDAHVANSEYTARELREAMRPPHVRPVHVCTMGVDPLPAADPRDAAACRARLTATGSQDGSLVLIYAGRLSAEKNVLILPEVVAGVSSRLSRPIHLIVAGEGPLRGRLLELSKALAPGRVHCVGHVPHRGALATLIAAADAFVHPNPREPFGIGVLEAMSAGVAVVAPAAGGVLSYANADNAWLTPEDPAAFADAIASCLVNHDQRRRRVEVARLTAEDHAWPAAAARMLRRFRLIRATHAGTLHLARAFTGSPETRQDAPHAPTMASRRAVAPADRVGPSHRA
jgi:alpha-1,6-mannosyltransferase